MKKSQFEFSNPHLVKIEYHENDGFTYDPSRGAIDVPITIGRNKKIADSSHSAEVSLQIQIGQSNNTLPFYIEIVLSANFQWNSDVFSEEQVSNLLSQNAPALLLSYARPIIASITNVSAFPTYNIPFLDFTQSDE